MKIYGTGVFTGPGSRRVVWDFADGPFDTVNPALLAEAKKRGYSFVPPAPQVKPEKAPEKRAEPKPKDTPKKRGRKPKVVSNVNPEIDAAH